VRTVAAAAEEAATALTKPVKKRMFQRCKAVA
jgi:hypothetical protein